MTVFMCQACASDVPLLRYTTSQQSAAAEAAATPHYSAVRVLGGGTHCFEYVSARNNIAQVVENL